MQEINQLLALFNEALGFLQAAAKLRQVAGMCILNKIDAVIGKRRIEKGKGRKHVSLHVAAIINDNVGRPKFFNYAGKKGLISLIASAHMAIALFKLAAGRIDVYANNGRKRTEPFFPDWQAAAAKYPDFIQGYCLVAKPCKVRFIDGKIMCPLLAGLAAVIKENLIKGHFAPFLAEIEKHSYNPLAA